MTLGEEASIERFKAFYEEYCEACRNGDVGFLRLILPPDIPEDELAFVLDISRQSTLAVDASGLKPAYEISGDRIDVVYDGDLGDGITRLTVDFYYHSGRWLKYNPEEQA